MENMRMAQLQIEYDYIIAGGGLSGLTLALKIQEKLPEKQVLIIDKEEKIQNNRTWSFWDLPNSNVPDIAIKSWQNIRISDRSESSTISIAPYVYKTIRGIDFYEYAKMKLGESLHFHFCTQTIIGINHKLGEVELGNGQKIKGHLIFKSYFNYHDLSVGKEYPMLHQQFKGKVIKSSTPIFDDTTVDMMDFNSPDHPTKDLRFFYVLPFSKYEALVEYTIFARSHEPESYYDGMIDWYLKTKLKVSHYDTLETEFNSIPMTNYPFEPKINGKVISIGTLGGFVKPSSGYAFKRTFDKTEKIVNEILIKGELNGKAYRSPFHYRLFDSIFLDLLYHYKVPPQTVFKRLYTKIPSSVLFRFLDEQANWKDILTVMAISPQKHKFCISFGQQLLKGHQI